MISETYAHHVIDFPFVPICRAPYSGDSGYFPFFLGDIGFQSQIAAVPIAIEMIDKAEPGIVAVIVDARDVHKVIKAQFLFGKLAHLWHSLRRRYPQADLASEFDWLGNKLAKFGFKLLG